MAGVSRVFTMSRVAEMLGEDEDWLQEVCSEMDPEDGRLTIFGIGDETITAFTDHGVDNLIIARRDVQSQARSVLSLHAPRVTTPRSSPDANVGTAATAVRRQF
jgi:hypothetical protein